MRKINFQLDLLKVDLPTFFRLYRYTRTDNINI